MLLPLAAPRAVAADWQVASHHDGLTIYTRLVPGQDLKDFRGITRVHASMREVVAMLVDVDSMPDWFFNMREARVLDVGGPQGSFLYLVIKGFWPVRDRDAVVKVGWTQDPHTLALSFSGVAAPDYYPPMRERVRIPRMKSGWTITPVSATETEIQLDGNADPGGHVPVWLANLVVVLLPEKTLENLRERLERHEYYSNALSRDPRVVKMLEGVKFPGDGS